MKKNISKITLNVFLAILCIISVFPFFIMLMMSTYKASEVYLSFPIVPSGHLIENLKTVFQAPFVMYYWNSLYIAILNTIHTLILSTMAGFALAKYQFKLKKALYLVVIATLVIPVQLSTIGFVIEMKNLGLMGTHIPFYLAAASPFAVFWITSYIEGGLPSELLDSSRIDGCSEFGLFVRIVLPLIKPAIGTISLLSFLTSWNNFLMPMIMLTDQLKYTIPLGIKNFGNQYVKDITATILGVNLAVFPMLIAFMCYSKTLIKGITAGAVKG